MKGLSTRLTHYRNLHCRAQKALYNSFVGYGFSFHKIETIDTFQSDNSYSNGKEMFWIRTYMSNKNKYPDMNGLNLSDGGEGNKNFKMSEENKKKLSEHHKSGKRKTSKGYKFTEEQRKRSSETRKGIPNLKNRGKVFTKEHIAKILASRIANNAPRKKYKCNKPNWAKGMKNRWSDDERKANALAHINKGRPVIQFDMDGVIINEWPCIRKAAEYLNINANIIGYNLRGVRKSLPEDIILKYKKEK